MKAEGGKNQITNKDKKSLLAAVLRKTYKFYEKEVHKNELIDIEKVLNS